MPRYRAFFYTVEYTIFGLSGLVHDIGAYWKTKVGWFPIPNLSHDYASLI